MLQTAILHANTCSITDVIKTVKLLLYMNLNALNGATIMFQAIPTYIMGYAICNTVA